MAAWVGDVLGCVLMWCYTTWMLGVVGRRIGELGPGSWEGPGLVR